jgi:hypothetical protein
MKNEIITKMYNAVEEMSHKKEEEHNPGSDTIKCHNHDQVLDIVLRHFYSAPTGEKNMNGHNRTI